MKVRGSSLSVAVDPCAPGAGGQLLAEDSAPGGELGPDFAASLESGRRRLALAYLPSYITQRSDTRILSLLDSISTFLDGYCILKHCTVFLDNRFFKRYLIWGVDMQRLPCRNMTFKGKLFFF